MNEQRKLWLNAMLKITSPVFNSLANGTLHNDLPVDLRPEKNNVRCLEAFARSLCGVAPWLELEGLSGEEAEIQSNYRATVRKCIENATDPESPDFLNFCIEAQPLVDTAFMAHGILRAPNQLYHSLSEQTKYNLIKALKSSRVIKPYNNNWHLFASMVEAALYYMGEEVDEERLFKGIDLFENKWYCGDGMYGDGAHFHFDYYNSFVIQPMFLDTVRVCMEYSNRLKEMYPLVLKRASRYATILERMIAPDGTYIVVGRSVCYRFGAFQLLSQAALQGFIPDVITSAQVRCALTAVIDKCMEAPTMFRENGWLNPGVYGHQEELGDRYINTGSLYLCSAVFFALGLSPNDKFWTEPDTHWTQKAIWSGQHVQIDHAID